MKDLGSLATRFELIAIGLTALALVLVSLFAPPGTWSGP
jgi:hypothetical protein